MENRRNTDSPKATWFSPEQPFKAVSRHLVEICFSNRDPLPCIGEIQPRLCHFLAGDLLKELPVHFHLGFVRGDQCVKIAVHFVGFVVGDDPAILFFEDQITLAKINFSPRRHTCLRVAASAKAGRAQRNRSFSLAGRRFREPEEVPVK